jgi:PAS domain S-box-containing protein
MRSGGAMPVGEPDQLVRSLEGLPVAAILTELTNHRFVGVNEQATAIFGLPADELIGTDVLTRVYPRDREAARQAYAAMASKAIDGYQVRRRIVTPDGTPVSIDIWGRRVEGTEGLYGLWILVNTAESAALTPMLMMGAAAVVLAVTDHDWRIEYMSADAHLLGVKGSELRGFPLLGLVHPSDADEFLAAVARTATDQVAVTVRTRLRVGSEGWAERYCLIVRMCEHQPPRLGVVISAAPTEAGAPPLASALHENMRQCALEANAAQTLDALPALARLPHGSELSARQSEIVARLVAGERASAIARAMFLSPSTVRNHLVAIYRKFGVHSQAELLAALLRAVAQLEP